MLPVALLLVLAACAYWIRVWLPDGVARSSPGLVGDASPVKPGVAFPAEFRDVSPQHYDAALESMTRFWAAYAQSFRYESCTPDALFDLYRARDVVLGNLNELRLRVPEADVAVAHRLALAVERKDRELVQHLEDLGVRARVPGIHPGPLSDAGWVAV